MVGAAGEAAVVVALAVAAAGGAGGAAVLVEGSEGRTSFYWKTYPEWPPPILTETAHRVRPIRKGRSARWCRYGEEWSVFNTVGRSYNCVLPVVV